MPLVQRLAHDQALPHDKFIPNHAFSAGGFLWAQGFITKAALINAFAITAAEEAQLDQIKGQYDGLTANQKVAFHGKLESCGILLEGGFITQAQYKTMMGIT